MKKINISKSNMPIILAILISLGIAYFAYTSLKPAVYQQEAFVESVVVSRNIAPYTIISNGDLVVKRVLKGSVSEGSLQNVDQIVGKITNTSINEGSPIYSNQLDDASKHKDKQFISLPIDLNRSVGGTIKAGDIVDIYWIDDIPSQLWHKIAHNAIVVDKMDSSGKTVELTGVGATVAAPTLIVVSVDKTYMPQLIGASGTAERQVVLVKKLVADEEVTLPEETGNKKAPIKKP